MSEHVDAARSSPYRGLEPFDERDAAFFFGRERETRLITASLFAAPLTLLYGASGVGKSSVLRAGVLPRLRQRPDLLPVVFPTIDREGQSADASVVLRGWQTDPLGGIKESVAVALYDSAGEDRDLYARYQDAVLTAEMQPLREYLAACHQVSERRIMVILDQFEEYSLYHPEDDAFAEQFPAAVAVRDLSVSFLVSLREDALAKLDRFKGRIPTLWDSYRRVDHLDRAAAEDAIRLPLREYNRLRPQQTPVQIEDSLVEAVLHEVQTESVQFESSGSGTVGAAEGADARIETPYLQLVMMRLWEREQAERSFVLRSLTLQDEGGAAEIVRTHLDRVMEQFNDEERDVAARIFHRLVTPSGAKIAFSVNDLAQYEIIEPDRLAPILRRLEEGSRRILRRVANRSDAVDEPRYEIFHDRLGKAILAWRAKRLREQERDRKQREEAEQKRLTAETVDRYREQVDAAMSGLGAEGQETWSRIMFYLVATDGRRFKQPPAMLAELSKLSRDSVLTVLTQLQNAGILRTTTWQDEVQRFEVVDDALARTLLEWHSQFVLAKTRATGKESLRAGNAPEPEPGQSASSRDFPYRLAVDALRRGRVVPFLGAGASLSARPQGETSNRENKPFLPSARELKEILARECEFPPTDFEASDTAEVASFYAHQLGRDRFDTRLHEILGRPDYSPSATHRFLAAVSRQTPLTILTTNYDTLMEQALAESEQSYDVLAYVRGPQPDSFVHYPSESSEARSAELDFVNFKRTVVVRLHGPALPKKGRTGSYVMTEEDQIDWLLTADTPDSRRRSIPMFVRSKLSAGHLLSLGHSARDWTQRALLRLLVEREFVPYSDRSYERHSWAIALNPAPISIMTWQRYNVEVFNVQLNEWAARMHESYFV